MAYDAFLKIEGINGEVTREGFEGAIEVESFSWGVTQTGTTIGGGGGGAGKATFQDFHFTAATERSSPLLAKFCATGQHIKKAVLSLVKSQERAEVFLKYELEDVLISSYQTGGTSGTEDRPTDQFSLNFAKIEYDFISGGETTTFTFDVLRNTT